MVNNRNNNRSPLERLMRLGWDALENARNADPLSIEQFAQNTRDALETARKGIIDETSLKTFHFNAPTDNAASADVDLAFSVGEAAVYAIDSENVIESELKYLGSLSFGVSGDVQRSVFLRQSTPMTVGWANPLNWTTRPRWDVGLSSRVPIDLHVQAGIGEADLNLSGLKLQSLRVESNIGLVNLTLPTTNANYTGTIRAAAGPLAINIPEGATGNLTMTGGVGGLNVNIVEGAAVRIVVRGGVGTTIMKSGFSKTEAKMLGLPNTEIWQTPDFDFATRRVTLNIGEGLVGNLSVRVVSLDI